MSTDKTKKVLKKYTELQNEIKNLNERMNDKSGEYGKNFMKIKFNPDVNLPLNKILKLHASLIASSVFEKDDPDVFLDECLYEL